MTIEYIFQNIFIFPIQLHQCNEVFNVKNQHYPINLINFVIMS